jgi:hypothetical protein
MMSAGVQRLSSVDALADPNSLSDMIGPVIEVRTTPLAGGGYSSAALSSVEAVLADGRTRRFVLKRTRVDRDWPARRSGDHVGREALLLNAPDHRGSGRYGDDLSIAEASRLLGGRVSRRGRERGREL